MWHPCYGEPSVRAHRRPRVGPRGQRCWSRREKYQRVGGIRSEFLDELDERGRVVHGAGSFQSMILSPRTKRMLPSRERAERHRKDGKYKRKHEEDYARHEKREHSRNVSMDSMRTCCSCQRRVVHVRKRATCCAQVHDVSISRSACVHPFFPVLTFPNFPHI